MGTHPGPWQSAGKGHHHYGMGVEGDMRGGIETSTAVIDWLSGYFTPHDNHIWKAIKLWGFG